jgi:hypothetical protein
VFLLQGLFISAQKFTIEVLPGHKYLFYQHLFTAHFEKSKGFGVVHISNMSNWYEHDKEKGGMNNEIMNQVYISWDQSGQLKFMAGFFYANATGLKPAVALQFAQRFKNGLFVLVSRTDAVKGGSFELMSMLELQPYIYKKLQLYTRVQVMSNAGPYHHNRSYQRFRTGIQYKQIQTGIGLNVDEYGFPAKVKLNAGFFIRKAF